MATQAANKVSGLFAPIMPGLDAGNELGGLAKQVASSTEWAGIMPRYPRLFLPDMPIHDVLTGHNAIVSKLLINNDIMFSFGPASQKHCAFIS